MRYIRELAGSVRIPNHIKGKITDRKRRIACTPGTKPHPDIWVAYRMVSVVAGQHNFTVDSAGTEVIRSTKHYLADRGVMMLPATCIARSEDRAVVKFDPAIVKSMAKSGPQFLEADGEIVLVDNMKKKPSGSVRATVDAESGGVTFNPPLMSAPKVQAVIPLKRVFTLVPQGRGQLTPRERDLVAATRRKPQRVPVRQLKSIGAARPKQVRPV